MEHIKRGDFEDAIVMVPDLLQQEEFAALVSQSDKSKLLSEITQDMASKKIGWRNME